MRLPGCFRILLILTLVGLSIWALTSEVAIFLASSELDRKLSSMRAAVETVANVPKESQQYAAPEIVGYFRTRFPDLRLYVRDSSGIQAYPAGSPPLKLPDGWHDSSGLLEYDGRFYGWAHLDRNGQKITAMAQLTDQLLSDLVNLGRVTLSSGSLTLGDPDYNSSSGRSWDANQKSAQLRPSRGSALEVHNAGRVPPPVNRLDVDIDYVALYPHYHWSEPNKKHSGCAFCAHSSFGGDVRYLHRKRSAAFGAARGHVRGSRFIPDCRNHRCHYRRLTLASHYARGLERTL